MCLFFFNGDMFRSKKNWHYTPKNQHGIWKSPHLEKKIIFKTFTFGFKILIFVGVIPFSKSLFKSNHWTSRFWKLWKKRSGAQPKVEKVQKMEPQIEDGSYVVVFWKWCFHPVFPSASKRFRFPLPSHELINSFWLESRKNWLGCESFQVRNT